MIAAEDEQSSTTWENIVKNIKELVNSVQVSGGSGETVEIRVEMIDKWHTLPKYCSPVPLSQYSATLSEPWPGIKSSFIDILYQYHPTRSRVNVVSLMHYGTNCRASENYLTVYVSLGREWPNARSDIEAMLESIPYGFRLHMEHSHSVGRHLLFGEYGVP